MRAIGDGFRMNGRGNHGFVWVCMLPGSLASSVFFPLGGKRGKDASDVGNIVKVGENRLPSWKYRKVYLQSQSNICLYVSAILRPSPTPACAQLHPLKGAFRLAEQS